MSTDDIILEEATSGEYKYGFTTNIEQEIAEKGLNEDVIRFISAKKNEPDWLLKYRLDAFHIWQKMEEPNWAHVNYQKPDFQAISYYAAHKKKKKLKSLDEADPELLRTYERLGIPIEEQKILAGVAVDFVMDSESVFTSFKKQLAEVGIIFMSISEAVQEHPELVKK